MASAANHGANRSKRGELDTHVAGQGFRVCIALRPEHVGQRFAVRQHRAGQHFRLQLLQIHVREIDFHDQGLGVRVGLHHRRAQGIVAGPQHVNRAQ